MNSIEINKMLLEDEALIVLDVRTANEYLSGHIKDSINIDIRQADALVKIEQLDHNAKYIVHCHTNHRSKIVVEYMKLNGFKFIYQMMDGMAGWIQNRLPVAR